MRDLLTLWDLIKSVVSPEPKPAKPACGHTGLLLQPVDGAKECPVLALGHFQNRPVFVSALTLLEPVPRVVSLRFRMCRLAMV